MKPISTGYLHRIAQFLLALAIWGAPVTIAKAAPLGVQGVLKSTRMAWNEGEAEAARHLFVDMVPVMQSEDAVEGVASFMQRREAVFKGR